jgi:hypothetical protein
MNDDVLDQARQIAEGERGSLGAVIGSLTPMSSAPIGISERDGLPVFDVPPDAPLITFEHVARALNGQ